MLKMQDRQAITHARETVHTIGELCVGGDWACAHGDFSALREVTQQLAAYLADDHETRTLVVDRRHASTVIHSSIHRWSSIRFTPGVPFAAPMTAMRSGHEPTAPVSATVSPAISISIRSAARAM